MYDTPPPPPYLKWGVTGQASAEQPPQPGEAVRWLKSRFLMKKEKSREAEKNVVITRVGLLHEF